MEWVVFMLAIVRYGVRVGRSDDVAEDEGKGECSRFGCGSREDERQARGGES